MKCTNELCVDAKGALSLVIYILLIDLLNSSFYQLYNFWFLWSIPFLLDRPICLLKIHSAISVVKKELYNEQLNNHIL